jgi:phosphate transport system substrate-binding protein
MIRLRTKTLLVCLALVTASSQLIPQLQAQAAESKGGKLLMTGAGSTFINPLFSKWFSEYNKKFPNVEINYQSIGSGGGIKQLQKKTIDFGATDVPMTAKEHADAGAPVLHFPVAIGAVVLSYNLPELRGGLNLDASTIAAIVKGKIKSWDDPALKALNPTLSLPKRPLVFIYRSDSSGTTGVFTEYLGKSDPTFEKEVGVGKAIKWPTGLGGKGNEGVTANLKNTVGSIGYVELTYALNEKLPMAAIKNPAGKFVLAELGSVTEAAAQSLKSIPDDFKVSLTNAPGAKSYPISSFAYLLAYEKTAKPAGDELVRLMSWALVDGQKMAPALGYAPLPAALVKKMQPVLPKMAN